MKPIVSIVMPFRDAADTLDAALVSMRTQTMPGFELLAIDDGSRDRSAAVVAAHAAADARIRLLGNPGRGIVDALNFGLARAGCDIVVRMDADDLMAPGRLDAQLRGLRSMPGIAVLGTRVEAFPPDRITAGFAQYLQWQNACLSETDIADEIYVEAPFAHPSVAMRRDVVAAAGGYRTGEFPEDYELWLRLHAHGARMAKLPVVGLAWRDSGERLSRTDPRYAREAFDRLRADWLARDDRVVRRRHELVIWGAGRRTRQRCAHLLGHGFDPVAWIDVDPRKIGNRIDGVPVVAPVWLDRRPRPFVLVYVSNHGARDAIAADLGVRGYRRGRDYLCVG